MSKLNKQKISAGISTTKRTGKQLSLLDGAGLELRLSGSNFGLGEWSLNSSFNGKRKRIHLGYYFHNDISAGLSIDEARSVAFKVKVDIKKGTPIQKIGKHNVVTDKTILVGDFYYNNFLPQQSGKSKTHLIHCRMTIDALEKFGLLNTPIEELNMQAVLSLLNSYKETPSAVKAICRILNTMSSTAAAIFDTPKRSFKAELITGKVESTSRVGIPIEKLDEWFLKLKAEKNTNIKARLCLLLLTLNRNSEIALMPTDWVDYEAGCIVFPASVMKTKKEHLVPTTPLVSRLLNLIGHPVTSGKLGETFKLTRPSSEYTIHGFRSLGATILHQLCGDKAIAVERCLAHETKGQVEKVYNRYNYLEEMTQVKLTWEKHLIEHTNILDFIEHLESNA